MRVKIISGKFNKLGAFIMDIDYDGCSGDVFYSFFPYPQFLNAYHQGIDLDDITFGRTSEKGEFAIREDHPAFNIDVLADVRPLSHELARSVMISIKKD
jgi:hypothetical protein